MGVGNILEVVACEYKWEEPEFGETPIFPHPNYFPDKLCRGVVPHLGYPVAHFGNPAQQGQADVIHVPRTDAGRAPLRMPYLISACTAIVDT